MLDQDIRRFVKDMLDIKKNVLEAYADSTESLRLCNRHGDLALLSPSLNPEFDWRVTYFKEDRALNHTEHGSRIEAILSFQDCGYLPKGMDFPALPETDAEKARTAELSL